MRGRITFVSFWQGDPALRTARAEVLLAQADRVIDAREPVSVAQLLELAQQGQRVVRQIDGDAPWSGPALDVVRGLVSAGVDVEVVPAVGASSVAMAFAGVVGRAQWVEVAGLEHALELAGADPAAHVTLVVRPGQPSQRVAVTTARQAGAHARELGEGRVLVALGVPEPALRWFEGRPLFGKRVLVTRASAQAGSAAALLREAGAEPVLLPTIELVAPADDGPLRRALGELQAGAYRWVVFTSVNGVDRTWDALVAAGRDARVFGAARIAAIGPATAASLARHGLHADVVARESRAEGLARELLEAMGAEGASPGRALLPRAARGRDELPAALGAAGWAVDAVVVYETRPPGPEIAAALRAELGGGRIDAVVLTSGSTVEHLCDLLGEAATALLSGVRLASIGPVTSQAARSRGLRVDVEPGAATVPALVEALAGSYGRVLFPVAGSL